MDLTADATFAIEEAANCTVTARLDGVPVCEPFSGIFDEHAQVAQPWESERAIVKPALTVTDASLAGITSAHTLEIRGVEYKFDGKPQPDGTGLTVVYLGVKR